MDRRRLLHRVSDALIAGDHVALAPLVDLMAQQRQEPWTALCFTVTVIWSWVSGTPLPPGSMRRGLAALSRRSEHQQLAQLAVGLLSRETGRAAVAAATCRWRMQYRGTADEPEDCWLAIGAVTGAEMGDVDLCGTVSERLGRHPATFLRVGPGLPVGPSGYFLAEVLAVLDRSEEALLANEMATRALPPAPGSGLWAQRVATQTIRLVALTRLNARQRAVLRELATGATLAEVAHRLHVSRATVERASAQALCSLGATSRAEAVAMTSCRTMLFP